LHTGCAREIILETIRISLKFLFEIGIYIKTSSMQKTSNQVSNRVEDINKESTKDIRAELVRNNRSCGLTNGNLVQVESNACYFAIGCLIAYNSIFSNIGCT
jgi:NAD-specific glutamate dehydrogenase